MLRPPEIKLALSALVGINQAAMALRELDCLMMQKVIIGLLVDAGTILHAEVTKRANDAADKNKPPHGGDAV